MNNAQNESQIVLPAQDLNIVANQQESSAVGLEQALERKNIQHINFEKNATFIDKKCREIGFDRLVSHPNILRLWSFAKFTQGEYYEAVNISHALIKLFRYPEDKRLLCDQQILLAKSYLALSDISQAVKHYKMARNLADDDAHRLYEISLLNIRLLLAQGHLEQAQETIKCDVDRYRDTHMLIVYRILEFILKLHTDTFCEADLSDFSDFETLDPYQPELTFALRQSYIFGRLVYAHALIHCGQTLRAQQLIPSGSYPRILMPHTFFVQAEIALCEGNFSYASKLLAEALTVKGSGLSRNEMQAIYWLRAMVSLGLESRAMFEVHTNRFKDSLNGTHCLRWKQRAYLFSALAAGLNKDFRKEKMCLHECDIIGAPLGQNNELLDFLARGLIAYNDGGFEEYVTAQQELHSAERAFKNNHLYMKALAQAQPLFFEMIIKRDGIKHIPATFLPQAYVSGLIEKRDFHILSPQDITDLATRYRMLYCEEVASRTQKRIGITLLGALGVEVEGVFYSLSSWRKSKARELFIALAASAGKDISRDELLERFWPEKDETSARNCFYVTWSNMKKHLTKIHPEFASLIPSQSSGSRNFLSTDICTIDLLDFSRSIATARRAEILGKHQEALHHFSLAAQLYRGDLLPGDTTIEWLDPVREYHHTMFIEAMIAATELSIECGDLNQATFFIESALGLEKGREVLYEHAMQVYAKAGRREDAIRSYHACKKYLNEELGLDPSERLKKLYVSLLQD